MMNCLKRLNDVFPDGLTGSGIFTTLNTIKYLPWVSDVDISNSALDIEYFGNVSGGKIVSPLIDRIVEGATISSSELTKISNIIISMYYQKWAKLYATLNFEYDPIENYSMVEQMTNDQTIDAYGKTRTRTDNLSHTKSGTETDTPNTTETQTPNLSNTRKTETHGFNSEQSVNMDADRQTATGTNTVTRTGQEQRTYNTTDADTGTQTDNDGGQDTHTRNYRLTRSGNIGVTTSQQMITQERELRLWDFFHTVIFPDIDRVMTIQIY